MDHKIICVVNNTVLPELNLNGEHGLSFWIEMDGKVLLFDTGQTSQVLSHNLKALNLDPRDIQALALSHAHFDHTGGLDAVLSVNKDLTLYAHPDIFRPRYSYKNGQYEFIGMSQKLEELSIRDKLDLSSSPVQVIPGIWTTGEISERPEPEGRTSQHFLQNGEGWQPDLYRDDMSLVMEFKDELILVCGCCHAGLLNTLMHVQRIFNKPIRAVLGGVHLRTAEGVYLRHVVDVLAEKFPETHFFLNHCSGEEAIQVMGGILGDRIQHFPAGNIFSI